MNTQRSIFVIFAFLSAVLFSWALSARDMAAIDVQKNMLVSEGAGRQYANADISIKISLPDYPSIKPIFFHKNANMPYTSNRGMVLFAGSRIPTFYNELDDVPASLRPVTVAVSGQEGNVIYAGWDNQGRIRIEGLDLKVNLYQRRRAEINNNMRGVVDFVLKDIQMESTSVDEQNSNAVFTFAARLPYTNHELFNEYLSGKQINGEVTIQLADPSEYSSRYIQ